MTIFFLIFQHKNKQWHMMSYYHHIQAHRPIQRTAITHSVRLTKAQGQRDGLHKKALFPPQFS